MKSKDELYKNKNKLNEEGDDINKKTKYIDELEKIREDFNYQNTKVIELESKLNGKSKDIKDLKKI